MRWDCETADIYNELANFTLVDTCHIRTAGTFATTCAFLGLEPGRESRSAAVRLAPNRFAIDSGTLAHEFMMTMATTQKHERAVLGTGRASLPFPADLVLKPLSRCPIKLAESTEEAVLSAPIPTIPIRFDPGVPRASIVVVAYNNLVFNRMCLESVLANTDYPNYEIIVVDNASTDETPAYLRELARRYRHIRVLFNDRNLGFAPANNQAFRNADGEILVLLNNDTIVTPGWLHGLVRHVDDPTIGMVGPVTNRIGNEAEIPVDYRTYGEMILFANEYTTNHYDEQFEIRMLAMYCAALRRDTFEAVGPLDEQFEIGMFEDDDYAMRLHSASYRIICVENVFVHHFGQASFGALAYSGKYGSCFHANRARWQKKWAKDWIPYQRRTNTEYRQLIKRLCNSICSTLPRNAVVIVLSKGDNELLALGGRVAWHFPQNGNGQYSGFYPADGEDAVAQLEKLRNRGANYLLVPAPSLWWLDHYSTFGEHLRRHYVTALHNDDCICFEL